MTVLRSLRERFAHRHDPYPCSTAVELVTEYLDGAMSQVDRQRFEHHLRLCEDCTRYVEQVRRTVDSMGRIQPVPPDETTRAALLEAFRNFRRE